MSVFEQILQEIQSYETEMEEAGIYCLCPAWVEEIIKKHLSAEGMNDSDNDGWIPVEDRLPKVSEDIDDDDCPEFNVTIDGADKATTLKCSSDGAFFDDNGYVYPVTAWQPLPEPYKPEKLV